MHLVYPAVLSALLFCVGVYGVLARRNVVLVLMAVELMLNAVNLNLVAFDVWLRDTLHAGQALTLFTITVAAAEIGLGLAIVLMLYRRRGIAALDRLTLLADRPDPDGGPDDPDSDDPDDFDDDFDDDGPDGDHGPGAAPRTTENAQGKALA